MVRMRKEPAGQSSNNNNNNNKQSVSVCRLLQAGWSNWPSAVHHHHQNQRFSWGFGHVVVVTAAAAGVAALAARDRSSELFDSSRSQEEAPELGSHGGRSLLVALAAAATLFGGNSARETMGGRARSNAKRETRHNTQRRQHRKRALLGFCWRRLARRLPASASGATGATATAREPKRGQQWRSTMRIGDRQTSNAELHHWL